MAALLPLCACGASAPRVAEVKSQPAPEYQKLGIWVGDWTYECDSKESPFGPAGKSTGKAVTRYILDGYFIEWVGEEQGAWGNFRWREIDGYDRVAGKYYWNGFGSDGSWYPVTYSFEGATMRYEGTGLTKDKRLKIRGTVKIGPKGYGDVREFSPDGETWKPMFECTFTRTGGGR